MTGTSHTFDYTYDVDGQLVEVHRDGALVEQYGYDNDANRTSTLATSATYDHQDRLIQQGGVSYTFDADGYLTTRGSDAFTYSAQGELLSATVGGQTITYHYDGMGRRIGRTDEVGTVQYLYGIPENPFQVTASWDVSDTLTTYFYDTAGNLFSFERGGQRYYVAADQLGTPKAVSDAAGSIIKIAEYDAWGVKISDTNPEFDLPIGFAGGIASHATGLVRFGFRDFEPGTGRWAAKDPILFDGGQFNLLGYVGNDPVNRTDPFGLHMVCDQPHGCYYHTSCINSHEHPNRDAAEGRPCFNFDPPINIPPELCEWGGKAVCIFICGMAPGDETSCSKDCEELVELHCPKKKECK